MFNSIHSSSRTMAMFIGLPVAAVISGDSIIADQIPASPATPPFSDYSSEKPGVQHHITPADLPEPFATEAVNNGPKVVPRPEGRCRRRCPATR